MSSYADVAASGPAQTPQEAASAPLPEVVSKTELQPSAPPEASEASLVDVSAPHVSSMSASQSTSFSNISSQPSFNEEGSSQYQGSSSRKAQSQTSARLEETAGRVQEKAREVAASAETRAKKAAKEVKKGEQTAAEKVRENPVLLGNVLVTALIGGTVGFATYRRWSRGENLGAGWVAGGKNGVPGYQTCPNNLVPAPGDTAHAFEAPGKNDIRGPCPGINTAANHHFLSHDGITTFNELIDMQQNVYGVGYDLAVLLAVLGVGLDGDVVSGKLSIGCDATSRTSTIPLSDQPGLEGHNKFEGDTSLTRNDYFLANGDNFSMNTTLFQMMAESTGGNFGRDGMAKYRYERYQQSRADNGQFYFGPKSVLLYGAASFLYELFPSKGEAGTPDLATQMSFFGVKKQGNGYVNTNNEQLPKNWYSRVDPYTIPLVAAEIAAQYFEYPVSFGGNQGTPGTFIGAGAMPPFIDSDGKFNASGAECLLYQVATEDVPSSLNGLQGLTSDILSFMRSKIGPIQQKSPCPLNYNFPGKK